MKKKKKLIFTNYSRVNLNKILFRKSYRYDLDYVNCASGCVIVSLVCGYLDELEINATLQEIKKNIPSEYKNIYNLVIAVNVNSDLTKKSKGIRMGKGKGVEVYKRVCFVSFGKVLFFLGGLPFKKSFEILSKSVKKLSIKCIVY